MKMKSILILLSVVFFMLHTSCSKDDDGINEVTLKVYSNTPGVPINLVGGFPKTVLTIKDYYEESWRTEANETYIKATCDDNTVLITVEVYINGKLKEREVGNSWLRISFKIK